MHYLAIKLVWKQTTDTSRYDNSIFLKWMVILWYKALELRGRVHAHISLSKLYNCDDIVL